MISFTTNYRAPRTSIGASTHKKQSMTITTMNIISPLQRKQRQLTITMPSSRTIAELPMIQTQTTSSCNDEQQLIDGLDVHAIFVLLEKQRIKMLRELYHGKRRLESKKRKDTTNLLPPYPPRYACLKDLPSDWLVSELKKRHRHKKVPHKPAMELSTLDQVTKTFLEDVINILQEEYGTSLSPSRIPPLPTLNPLSSEATTLDRTTITPPSSPLTLPVVIEDCILTDDRRSEVNMTDSEIVSLWNACD